MVLSYLHVLIEKVCPIDGVSYLGNNEYRIDYKAEATEEQKEAALAIIENWPLLQAKEDKLNSIAKQWADLESAGWDCGNGHLGLAATDVALLSGAFSLAKEAAALGLPIPSLITIENNQIDFNNIQEMTMLMLQYGAARAEMSKQFAARRRAVEAATTIEEVNGI